MYLITAYFDESTNKRLQGYINRIADTTGNSFMSDHCVPPHMTLSAFESRDAERLSAPLDSLRSSLYSGSVHFVSVGALFPYVLYAAPVLDAYLQNMSEQIFSAIKGLDDIRVSRFYQPYQWLPHVTLGKTLDRDQMLKAFSVMQTSFSPFSGKITEIGLARVNPHEDMIRFLL